MTRCDLHRCLQVSRCCAGARKWLDLHCKQCRLERTYPRFTVCALWNPFRRTDQRFPFFGSPWCREAAASISVGMPFLSDFEVIYILCPTVATMTFLLSLPVVEEAVLGVSYGPLYPGALKQFSWYHGIDALQI
uniref:Uncharacterized protein n=1 Tax=Parascaris equorum TaxID=6256 RepID=A0A914R5X6_PAREQ